MKRLNIETMIVAALITIPLAIATVKAHEPEKVAGAAEPSRAAVQESTEAEIKTETAIIEEIATKAEKQPNTAEYESTAPSFEGYNFIPLDADMQCQIYELCERYEIAYGLVISIILTESGCRIDCIGDGGNSIGLMQIQPKWWQGLADAEGLDIYDPVDNVHLGIIILMNALEDNQGDLFRALKQYNSGNPDYPGDEYVNKVLSNYEWLEGENQQ